jgi:peroxiredoxin
VRSWASSAPGGATRRGARVRIGIAVLLLAGMLWVLPGRRAEEHDAHHHDHPVVLDAFEKAGVTEFKEGQRGPGLRLRVFGGDGAMALEDLAGKLVLLNFWATWCGPCTDEMPTLEALWRQYRTRGLVVLGVSVDRGAPRAIIAPYLERLGLTFPVLVDPDMRAAGAWRVTGLPATFIVTPDGDVAGMAAGAREWDSAEMRALLEGLLPAAR